MFTVQTVRAIPAAISTPYRPTRCASDRKSRHLSSCPIACRTGGGAVDMPSRRFLIPCCFCYQRALSGGRLTAPRNNVVHVPVFDGTYCRCSIVFTFFELNELPGVEQCVYFGASVKGHSRIYRPTIPVAEKLSSEDPA